MRFVRKGGVWKNTEDEILKAAVMKYGKNQWARVSSLLIRKSAKQCKARWHEWLDPSVKKTEWTRDEEEKLLHLAKIMPSQWRSIATVVGRTSTQCLEHYARLLDAAQQEAGGDSGGAAAADDPRKLRPGEIDPHPETKPARPDPVDMDEDEKEMLSEARARLANTKGKKAKRKAREKQLEEARRLAALQKKRELKAAGIEFRGRSRLLNKNKRKQMDFNVEIPFERRAPAGFFDTGKEDDEAKRIKAGADAKFIGKSLVEVAGKSRDQKEEEARAKDAKRQKLQRKHNLPQYVERVNALNDARVKRQRPLMNLPSPQVTEADLQHLSGAVSSVPDASLRTPRLPASADSLMLEAKNLAMLERAETPLKGGDNAALHDATPRTQRTPSVSPAPSLQSSRRRKEAVATPMTDQLRINDDDAFSATSTPQQRKELSKRAHERIRRGLASLPKPRNDYALVMPDIEDDQDDQVNETFVPDADDMRVWEERKVLQQRKKEFERQSSVLQRPWLPRPSAVDAKAFSPHDEVQQEMLRLVRADLSEHPLDATKKTTTKKKKKAVALKEFSDEQIAAARAMIEEEMTPEERTFDADEDLQAFVAEFNDWMFLPSHKAFGKLSEAAPEQRLQALRQRLELLRGELDVAAKKAVKSDGRASLLNEGYLQRAAKQRTTAMHKVRELGLDMGDLSCFEALRAAEQNAVPVRLGRLEEEARAAVQTEQRLQDEYYEVNRRIQALQKALASS